MNRRAFMIGAAAPIVAVPTSALADLGGSRSPFLEPRSAAERDDVLRRFATAGIVAVQCAMLDLQRRGQEMTTEHRAEDLDRLRSLPIDDVAIRTLAILGVRP